MSNKYPQGSQKSNGLLCDTTFRASYTKTDEILSNGTKNIGSNQKTSTVRQFLLHSGDGHFCRAKSKS